MFRQVFALAALGALAACSAAADPRTDTATSAALVAEATAAMGPAVPGLSCEVRLTPTRGGLRIEALAHSGEAFSGEYELVVTKTGTSGSSDITQGGPIEIRDSAELILGAAEFGLDRGDHYQARLSLRGESGATCTDQRRS